MIISWIICGGLGLITGWHFSRAGHYKKKWGALQSKYDKRCEELTNAQVEMDRLYKLCKSRQDTINHLICACKDGRYNLNIKIWECPDDYFPELHPSYVSVVGSDKPDSGWYFTIKKFDFDKNDPEDREFAIREAEELIETINKA